MRRNKLIILRIKRPKQGFFIFLFAEKTRCIMRERVLHCWDTVSKNCGRGLEWSSSAILADGVRIVAAFSFYFREKNNYYYERKQWMDAGGNPAVRHEGVAARDT